MRRCGKNARFSFLDDGETRAATALHTSLKSCVKVPSCEGFSPCSNMLRVMNRTLDGVDTQILLLLEDVFFFLWEEIKHQFGDDSRCLLTSDPQLRTRASAVWRGGRTQPREQKERRKGGAVLSHSVLRFQPSAAPSSDSVPVVNSSFILELRPSKPRSSSVFLGLQLVTSGKYNSFKRP